ncbi:hypothetical protein SAMN05428942_2123 [Streptomyces sp. 2112.2]|nr:hypothetical protein SAMN05428942_2123 [Streptomyces sp. 2112.2]
MPTLHQYPYAAPKADAHCAVFERQANAVAFDQLAAACPAVREHRILPDPDPITLPPLHIRRTGHFCTGQLCEPWTWSCRRCSTTPTSRSHPGALAAALHHLATTDHPEPTNGAAQ